MNIKLFTPFYSIDRLRSLQALGGQLNANVLKAINVGDKLGGWE